MQSNWGKTEENSFESTYALVGDAFAEDEVLVLDAVAEAGRRNGRRKGRRKGRRRRRRTRRSGSARPAIGAVETLHICAKTNKSRKITAWFDRVQSSISSCELVWKKLRGLSTSTSQTQRRGKNKEMQGPKSTFHLKMKPEKESTEVKLNYWKQKEWNLKLIHLKNGAFSIYRGKLLI